MVMDMGRKIRTKLSVGIIIGLVLIGLVGIPAYVKAASTVSSSKAEMMGRVEHFFLNNFRDVTARKSIEWGEVEKYENGNRSIRYKYYGTIWDKDTQIDNKVFTFDPQGNFVSVKNVEGFPNKSGLTLTEDKSLRELKELEEKSKRLISLDFKDVHLREVLKYLSKIGGVNIVLDETVFPLGEETELWGSPQVTIHLKDVPLIEALQLIIRPKGLSYRLEGNIIWITISTGSERGHR